MALLGTYVKLGLWTISSSWIGMFVGVGLALWLIKREANRAGWDGLKVRDLVFDSVFYGILAALLSPLLLMPREVLDRPFQILLGGLIPYASWIGWGTGMGYFLYKFRKHPIPLLTFLDVLVPAVLAGWAAYSILVADYGTRTELFWGVALADGTYHPVNVYRAVLFAISGWFIIQKVPLRLAGTRGALGLMMLGTGGLLISLVDYNPILWLFLTPIQWGLLLCGTMGAILLTKADFFGTSLHMKENTGGVKSVETYPDH
ncbi:hypothetical protein [Effusibacillus pohliae]|uniref:hypothetical protein n=1 Tax=Effusibacillus pohliae TaxID=232270 RepID=UPI00036B76B2|nr:hypothetical protein [Effusibacillus pohliae]